MDVTLYYNLSATKGPELTDKFYDASLSEKREVAQALADQGLLLGNYQYRALYNLVVKGILQHSSRRSKRNYPIRGDRKQRPAAAAADRQEAFDALFTHLDAVCKALYHDTLTPIETCNGPLRIEWMCTPGRGVYATQLMDTLKGNIDPENLTKEGLEVPDDQC